MVQGIKITVSYDKLRKHLKERAQTYYGYAKKESLREGSEESDKRADHYNRKGQYFDFLYKNLDQDKYQLCEKELIKLELIPRVKRHKPG